MRTSGRGVYGVCFKNNEGMLPVVWVATVGEQ